jgi:hypothetical protein
VSAFINLQRITSFAKQSWAATHRSLSSALLLCIIGETNRVDTTRQAVGELIDVMTDMYSDLGASEVPSPVSRSIAVLQSFVSPSIPHQQIAGLVFEGDGTTQLDGMLRPSTPSSIQGISSDDFSPYSKMNHILWGKDSEHSV